VGHKIVLEHYHHEESRGSLPSQRGIEMRSMSDKEFLELPTEFGFGVGAVPMLVVRSSGVPGDPCPPTMINDCSTKANHKGRREEDYVNTNITSTISKSHKQQLSPKEEEEGKQQMKAGEESNSKSNKQTSLLALSSGNRNDDFLQKENSRAITNKIRAIGEATPSFDPNLCQHSGMLYTGLDLIL
jgi:hypothetical protein